MKINCKINEIALIEIRFNLDGVAIEDTVIFSKSSNNFSINLLDLMAS
ncbi:MAG: hypothetical protein RR636_04820 [Clostridium sp.]